MFNRLTLVRRLTSLQLSLLAGLLSLFVVQPIYGQTAPVPRDPEGLRLIQRAETVLIGNRQIKNAVLQGNQTSHLGDGPIFTASVKLAFLDGDHSRIDYHSDAFGVPSWSDICTINNQGQVVAVNAPLPGEEGPATLYKLAHGFYANCWSVPVWFFPAMLLKSVIDNPHSAIIYRGSGNTSEAILRFYDEPQGSSVSYWQNLTVREVRLDRRSLLPVSVRFWRGAQSQALPLPPADPLSASNHAIEVHYSDYRDVGGIWTPFRLDWSQDGISLVISIAIESARFNVGPGEVNFAVPARTEAEPQ